MYLTGSQLCRSYREQYENYFTSTTSRQSAEKVIQDKKWFLSEKLEGGEEITAKLQISNYNRYRQNKVE